MAGDPKCDSCSFYGRADFPTEAAFAEFQKHLFAKISAGELVEVEDADPERFFHSSQYRCASCGCRWQLVHPDQAFRGTWKAIDYHIDG